MILSGIRLSNFRNHADTAIEFGPGINALLGDNGQGKTNILEAVSYLGLTKSFYAAGDGEALQIGKDDFTVEGVMISDAGVAHTVRVAYTRLPPVKAFLIDASTPETLASVIGRFPVVILSPENNAITYGSPAERRKFLDLTLSQVSSPYLHDVLEYRRALRQRNRVLVDGRLHGTPVTGVIEPWTESLVHYGGRIAHRRQTFVAEFRSYILDAYRKLVPSSEEPDIEYQCGFDAPEHADPAGMSAGMAATLEKRRGTEIKRGMTLAGPHRDEVKLTINGILVQQFASQGQHKSLLVALKVAEFFYVRERRGESPLLLLDDVFSELDRGRALRILGLVSELGQTMITTTDETMFGPAMAWGNNQRRFRIERGTCTPGP
jgi:DNA replication and repair protein RecF